MILAVGCTEPAAPELAPLIAAPVLEGGTWDPRFAPAGVSHDVTGDGAAIATIVPRRNGRIVATGSFELAGGVPVPGLAQWDGAQWEALPAAGTRASIVEDAGGTLWANAEGVLSRFDGATWTPVGTTSLGPGLVAFGEGVAVYGTGIELWTATAHRALTVPHPFVRAVVPTPEGLCAATNGGALCWDGSDWYSLGGSIDLMRLARTTSGTWWGLARIESDNRVAWLDESRAWQLAPQLGGALDSTWIEELATSGDDVVIGGRLARTDERGFCFVARLHAGAWTCEAATRGLRDDIFVAPHVTSLIIEGERIHVGGWFVDVDDVIASGVVTLEPNRRATALGSEPRGIARDVWTLRALPGRLVVIGRPAIEGAGLIAAATFDGTSWREATRAEAAVRFETIDGARYSLDGGIAARDNELLDTRGGTIHDITVHEGQVVGLISFERTIDEDIVTDLELAVLRDGRFEHLAVAPVAYQLASVPAVGLVATGNGTLDVWDGEAWQSLGDPPPSDAVLRYVVGACANGMYVATMSISTDDGRATSTLRFYDGERWSLVADLGHGRITGLAPTADGLVVSTFSSGSALHLLRRN